MNKKILYMAVAAGALIASGCDNYDDRYTDEYASVVRFDVFGEQEVIVEWTEPQVTYDFDVKRSGHSMATADISATVRPMTDEEWSYYASTYSTKHYKLLPGSCYKFGQSGVADSVNLHMEPGQNAIASKVVFDSEKVGEFVKSQQESGTSLVMCLPLTMDVSYGSVYSERKNLIIVPRYRGKVTGVIFADDFSWLNVAAVTTPAIMNDNTNKAANVFMGSVVASKGLNNPGWESASCDLSDDHSKRIAPNGDLNPANLFEYAYDYNYMHLGFLKLGKTSYAGAVISPAFEELGTQTADVEVTLQMCGCTSAGSVTAVGEKDAGNVYVGLWDGSDGEIEGADYDQKGPAGWMYKCKAFSMRNYWPSKFNEHGADYNPWNEAESLYKLCINGASAKTRLIIFGGGYGDEIKGRAKTTVTLTVNGQTQTFKMNPALNRIGLKGCWVEVID